MTTREPAWTDEDRAEILALAMYRTWLCPLHGGLLEDCTSHYDTGARFQTESIRCRATDTLLAAKEASTADRPEAVLWSVTKK